MTWSYKRKDALICGISPYIGTSKQEAKSQSYDIMKNRETGKIYFMKIEPNIFNAIVRGVANCDSLTVLKKNCVIFIKITTILSEIRITHCSRSNI